MLIKFMPDNKKWTGEPGKNLLEIAGEIGVSIDGSCAGKGTCGKCTVTIGNETVLACQFFPETDTEVITVSGKGVEQRKETLTNNLKEIKSDNEFYNEQTPDSYGVAFDIGTTTVVGSLWDLTKGEELGVYAVTNPQSIHGGDVISRITYARDSEDNLNELHMQIIKCINNGISKLVRNNNVDIETIKIIIAVGNTTMGHLFLGKDPISLAIAPFTPAYDGSVLGKMSELGLNGSKDGRFYFVPGIAGHVGADISAGIIASDLYKNPNNVLFIDIGTNGEIVLSHSGDMTACSTAAGPAFEGASIMCGMRAAEGAVEKVVITDESVECTLIGDCEPVGICGSGIMDAVAQMIDKGIVNKTGKLLKRDEYMKKYDNKKIADRIIETENSRYFLLTMNSEKHHIYISQQDVREVQLAKAAIAAGIKLLMRRYSVELDDLNEIIVAGAFGSHIDRESAQKIGLLPNVADSKYRFAGNTAGVGAAMMLLSDSEKERVEKIVDEIEHLELAESPDFQDVYLGEMSF